ncbi:MAG: preprotein translocase subunit YajC [Edaphocola sp.]
MTTNLLHIMLQAGTPGGAGMGMTTFLMIGMIVVMYFFMIRPQQKKAKEQKKFSDSMATGEKIVTTSGIHGRIVRSNDDGTVVVEIDRNTNITIERQAISMEMTMALQKKLGTATTVAAETVK